LRWSPACSTSTSTLIPAVQTFSINPLTGLNYRLVETCTKKCIPPDYREADLNKGESVCLDRCVAKFFDVNVKVSEKMQGEAAQRQQGGGGMFG
jgi:mitochondrial import inner membrane translocase subunit TIM10